MACKVKVNRHGFLAFRLYWDGHESWEGTGLRDTTKNRQRMEARAVLISEEMECGAFEYLKWFPSGNKASLFKPQTEKANERKAEPKTIRQRYDDWIKDKVPPIAKKSRGRKYRSHFTVHILPLHGDKWMHLYGVTEIRELLADLTQKKHLTVKTAKNVMNATLRAFFRDAVAEKVIGKNPFDELPKKWWPRTVRPEPDPFTEEERDRILDYFKSKYFHNGKGGWPQGFVFLFTQFWSGARPSETTARKWRDYDPRTRKVSITTSRVDGEEGPPKTAKSKRTIELLQPVGEYLEKTKPLHAASSDYIFTNRKGKPIDQKEFAERHFWPALSALNIRHRDFYATRDTFISVMLSRGENSKQIAEYCGTSLEMIEGSYGKWIGGAQSFGHAALRAARWGGKPKPEAKPLDTEGIGLEESPIVGMVRGRGFEPL